MMAKKSKPLTQKNIDYMKELIVAVEVGDDEATQKLTAAWRAVERINAREAREFEGEYGIPGISEDVDYSPQTLALFEKQKKERLDKQRQR